MRLKASDIGVLFLLVVWLVGCTHLATNAATVVWATDVLFGKCQAMAYWGWCNNTYYGVVGTRSSNGI